jgi:hypothetical protein
MAALEYAPLIHPERRAAVDALLVRIDAWALALALALVMFVAWRLGWRSGHRRIQTATEPRGSSFTDASLALLGLLLAFTFSLALSKHEQRRQMVVADANSIGDFHTCACLQKEPIRKKLRAEIKKYTELRRDLADPSSSEEQTQAKLAEIQAMQNRMQALVGEAVDAGTPVAVPLVNTFNEVTSNHASRLAAVRDRLPAIVVLLLVMAVIVSMSLMGAKQGSCAEWRLRSTIGFIILVAMAVGVTLDLNQPQRGMITVNQEPLQRLLLGMYDA